MEPAAHQSTLSEFNGRQPSLVDDLIEEIETHRATYGGQAPLFERKRPPAPKDYAVYTLSCELVDLETAKSRARRKFGNWRNWMKAAYSHEKRQYVGKTSRPYERMKEHESGDGAIFTSVFPPITLVNVEWYDSHDRATDRELELAESLRDDNIFVPYANVKIY